MGSNPTLLPAEYGTLDMKHPQTSISSLFENGGCCEHPAKTLSMVIGIVEVIKMLNVVIDIKFHFSTSDKLLA